jgi:hypothetical protein
MKASLIVLAVSIVLGIFGAQESVAAFTAELCRLGAFVSMAAFLVMANVGWKQAETAAPAARKAAVRKSVAAAHAYHAA